MLAFVLRGRSKRTVLLCGPMGGGATTLWHALQGRQLLNGTVTSMQPNESTAVALPVRHCFLCLPHNAKHAPSTSRLRKCVAWARGPLQSIVTDAEWPPAAEKGKLCAGHLKTGPAS